MQSLIGDTIVMFLDAPPKIIETRIFTAMPQTFRREGQSSAWVDQNRRGQSVACFLEGPSFDADGNLLVVDIAFGRIFSISPTGNWSLVVEYDGEPNGLKIHPDGRILIADYRNGLMELDRARGTVTTALGTRNGESFKGINDLTIASNGDVYFTDQGQTGLQDPSGRVFRLTPEGKLNCLLSSGISPNGLVLDPKESTLFVAMTRDNSVWRLPLQPTGEVSKVGRFCSLFGVSGPDGLTMDEAGNLIVAHASLAHAFVFAPNGECIARVRSCAGTTVTNVAFGGADRKQLFMTESMSGSILVADMLHPGIRLPRIPI